MCISIIGKLLVSWWGGWKKYISCLDKTFKYISAVNAFGYLLACPWIKYRVQDIHVYMYVPYMQFGGSGDLEMWYDIQLSTSQYRLDAADPLEMGILSACSTFPILYILKVSKKQIYSIIYYCKLANLGILLWYQIIHRIVQVCAYIALQIQSEDPEILDEDVKINFW